MSPDWVRPATAAERFDLSERTLYDWARMGLIGRSRVNGSVWYSADDIREVIEAGATRRRVVPISGPKAADASWRDDEFWRGAAR